MAPTKLANPLSEEASVLRSTGSVTMAAAIEWNLNHGQRSVKLFEIGGTIVSTERRRGDAVLAIARQEKPAARLVRRGTGYSFADLKAIWMRLHAGGRNWLAGRRTRLAECGEARKDSFERE